MIARVPALRASPQERVLLRWAQAPERRGRGKRRHERRQAGHRKLGIEKVAGAHRVQSSRAPPAWPAARSSRHRASRPCQNCPRPSASCAAPLSRWSRPISWSRRNRQAMRRAPLPPGPPPRNSARRSPRPVDGGRARTARPRVGAPSPLDPCARRGRARAAARPAAAAWFSPPPDRWQSAPWRRWSLRRPPRPRRRRSG